MSLLLNLEDSLSTLEIKTAFVEFSQNFLTSKHCASSTQAVFFDVNSQQVRRMPMDSAQIINERVSTNMPLRVFIADDSPLILEFVASILCASAMTIVGKTDTPQDSIEAILALYPDVVVLDVKLVGGTGLQVLRAIRHAAPDIAFVVFTNSSDPSYRKCYLDAGADSFLDKAKESYCLAQAVVKASRHPHNDF